MKRCTALVVGGLGVFVGMNCTPFGEAEPLNGVEAGAAYVGATPDAGHDAGSQDADGSQDAATLPLDGAPPKACSDRAPLLSANFDLGLATGWDNPVEIEGNGEGKLDSRAFSRPNAFQSVSQSSVTRSRARLRSPFVTTDAVALSFRIRVLGGGTVDRVRLAQVEFGTDYFLTFFLGKDGPSLKEFGGPTSNLYNRHLLPEDLGRERWAFVELEASLTAKTMTVRIDGTEVLNKAITPPYPTAILGLEIGLTADPPEGGSLTTERTEVLFDDVVLRDCGEPK